MTDAEYQALLRRGYARSEATRGVNPPPTQHSDLYTQAEVPYHLRSQVVRELGVVSTDLLLMSARVTTERPTERSPS